MEKMTLTTEDGVKIVGDWYPSSPEASKDKSSRFALLLHMMPATKESWIHFAEKLVEAGISCLAIDERGHGESNMKEDGTEIRYKEFSDEEQMAKQIDVEASLGWMKKKGMTEEKLAMIGASIGANLAITTLAAHDSIPMGIALSPGLDFRGVLTSESIKSLKENQTVLLCASEDDGQSFGSVNELNEMNKNRTHRIILENAGHGTAMFEKDPEFMGQVIDWVTKKL